MPSFLENSRKIFLQYKELGEKAMAQLEDKDLFFEPVNEVNSIAIIVQHLHGNMLSRWTDFLISDGEKDWRNRDREFENILLDRTAVMDAWDKGWNVVFEALAPLTEEDLDKDIFIRQQALSVMEAIQRQLTHYAYHVGQIVYLSKMAKGEAWETLSIAKGKSEDFNQKMK